MLNIEHMGNSFGRCRTIILSLPESGILDSKTMSAIRKPRCSKPDTPRNEFQLASKLYNFQCRYKLYLVYYFILNMMTIIVIGMVFISANRIIELN